MRPLVFLCALLALPGCYASHRGSGPDRRDAGMPSVDAGAPRVDAGVPRADAGRPTDAGTCDPSKFRTSGLADDFALGSRCDFLVVCMVASRFELVQERFPDARCELTSDFACGGEGSVSCIVNVDVLDEGEVQAGCELTLVAEVVAVVCSGDL